MIKPENLEPAIRAKYGNKYKKTRAKNGVELRICCPFCLRNTGKLDTKYHLWLNPQKETYHCFRCSASGGLSELFSDIRRETDGLFVTQTYTAMPDAGQMPGALMSLRELPYDHIALRYLRQRNFDPIALDKYYGVKYCYEGKPFLGGIVNTTNTLVLPIWMDNRLIGWQTRLLYDPDKLTNEECAGLSLPKDPDGDYIRPPKYFTSPGMDKGRSFFNYDMARKSEIVVVTEGPFDSIAVGPCGVATMGKGVTENQAATLRSYWKLVIVMLDPGDADKEMRLLDGSLRPCVHAFTVKLRGYKDPGEAPTKEIWAQIDEAAQAHGIDLTKFNWGPFWYDDILRK